MLTVVLYESAALYLFLLSVIRKQTIFFLDLDAQCTAVEID